MTDPSLIKVRSDHLERNPSLPWGTTTRQWAQAWNLLGRWVLPTCDDPHATPHPSSSARGGIKAPSRISMADGLLRGIVFTEREIGSTLAQVRDYANDPRHAVGMLCRDVRAIDIDFKWKPSEDDPTVNDAGATRADHEALTRTVMADLRAQFPFLAAMPYRWRPTTEQMQAAMDAGWTSSTTHIQPPEFDSPLYKVAARLSDSGSYVLLYRFSDDAINQQFNDPVEPFPKRTLHTPVGAVEFNGDGSFQVLTGRHYSGQPQLWRINGASGYDLPELRDVPYISRADVQAVMDYLIAKYPDPRNHAHPLAHVLEPSSANPDDDPVLAYMMDAFADARWKRLRSGAYACTCPNAALHSNPHCDKPDTTVYFPEGLAGAARGFKCQHAGCTNITVGNYLTSIGYTAHTALTTFSALPTPAGVTASAPPAPSAPALPALRFDDSGTILELTQYNINNLLCHYDHCHIAFSQDTFTGRAQYAINGFAPKMRHEATNNEIYHYLVGACRLDKKCSMKMIAESVELALVEHSHSSARGIVKALKHDGTFRLDSWLATALGEANTPYISTLGQYILTAIVGRILEPGLKVDITPIFYGPPGMRKSTLIERLALKPEWADAASLEQRDKDLMIQLLGKCVVELPELRGFATRDAEGIKAWLTMRADNFRMPYSIFAYERPRQFITIGTTNESVFLTERLSLRRFAPCEVNRPVDTDFITANIEQLYAEAVIRFTSHGTPWADLERLAVPHCQAVAVRDPWQDAIETWLAAPTTAHAGFTTSAVLSQALGLPVARQTSNALARVIGLLRSAGCQPNKDGSWRSASIHSTSV